jgi:hypothetical protein
MLYCGITRKGYITEAGDTANTVNDQEKTLAVCNITLRRDGQPRGSDSRGMTHA